MSVAGWTDYDEGYLRAYQWAGALAGGAALPQEPAPVALGPGETSHLHLSPVSLHGYFGQNAEYRRSFLLLGGPVGEGAMALWTAYDIVTIIPDLVKIGGGLITHIGDLKFPGDSYRNGAYDLYQLANNGKPPVTLTPESCKC